MPEEAAVPILAMHNVAKAYGPVVALRDVSFDVRRGEIHALLGENGAGKSTVVKILSGIVGPDAGKVALDGAEFMPGDPMAARLAGVSTAFQELSLLPNLTVAENLLLPRQAKNAVRLISPRAGQAHAVEILRRYGLKHIHPGVLAGALSLAEKQRIELVRAISRRPRFLILDEPTAALADPGWLFEILQDMMGEGTGVLYITHRLSEVRRLCRRGTVLRNGESIRTVPLDGVEDRDIFEMMVGKSAHIGRARVQGHAEAETEALRVTNLGGGTVRDISMMVRKREIVGVAGLEGQGQRDLFRMLAGLTPVRGGEIRVDERQVRIGSPAEAARAGIGFLPEERKTEGVFLGLRTDGNISLPVLGRLSRFGIIERRREREAVRREARRVDLAERYLQLRIGALSGGNQQKALLGRVLMSGARCLALFDPTRGVDVGTKDVIYGIIRDFAQAGGAALVYSTDLSELVQLVDRCVVVYAGRIVGEVSGEELSEARLVALAAGQGGVS